MTGLRRTWQFALVATLLVVLPGCVPSAVGGGTMEITAYFEDSAGLFEGNDVGILGVTVGTVAQIEPDGDQVEVTLEIDDEHEVPADAGAVIVARSVATDRYVELTPVYAGGAQLEDGGEIGVERTRSPVDFDEVLQALNTFSTGIAGNKGTAQAVRRIINETDNAVSGRGELFNQTLDSLSDAVTGVAGQRDDITATVVSLDDLVNTIATNEGTVRQFINQVSRASTQLADERENFRAALRSVDQAVTVVADFAVRNRAQFVQALGGTTRVMRTVLSRQKELEEFIEVFPVALQNLQLLDRVDDKLPVRIDPAYLFPLGAQLSELCEVLPAGLCGVILGTDPGDRAGLRDRRRGGR